MARLSVLHQGLEIGAHDLPCSAVIRCLCNLGRRRLALHLIRKVVIGQRRHQTNNTVRDTLAHFGKGHVRAVAAIGELV